MKKILSTLLTLAIVLSTAPSDLSAQDPPQGFRSWSLMLGGVRVTCSSGGRPVMWVADYGLNDAGHTMPGFLTIVYNPRILDTFPDDLKLWGMGHECGHAFNRNPSELAADCWSITTGIKHGWFGEDDFDGLVELFKDNEGDLNHPPGTARIANMKRCMERAIAAETPSKSRDSEDDVDTKSDTVHNAPTSPQDKAERPTQSSDNDQPMYSIGAGSTITVGGAAVVIPANTDLVFFQSGSFVPWNAIDEKTPYCRFYTSPKPIARSLIPGRILVVTGAEGDSTLLFKDDKAIEKLQCFRGRKGDMTVGELLLVMGRLFSLVQAAPTPS